MTPAELIANVLHHVEDEGLNDEETLALAGDILHALAGAGLVVVSAEDLERLRERVERAEAAIVRCVASVKKINLSGECPPDPSEWQRGYWACVDRVIGSIEAPYVDAAIDAIKRERTRRG